MKTENQVENGEHSEVSQARSLHARVLNKNAVS